MGCAFGQCRKLSKVGLVDTCESARPKDLTDAQKVLIRNNWGLLNSHIANIGVLTFIGMFESRPELKAIFAEFKDKNVEELQYTGLLRKHALRVMNTLDKCISRLDHPSSMVATLHKIGAHHLQYKVPVEYLESLLPHFLSAIKPHIEDCWCKDLEESWSCLFTVILFHIKEGMLQYSAKGEETISRTVS